MVESNAAKSAATWSKAAAGFAAVAIVAGLVGPGLYIQDVPNVLTEEQIQESVQKAIALQGLNVNVTEGPKTIAIYEEIFEDDAWESEAEVIAIEEVEKRDYKELGEFLVDKYDNLEDEDDIDRVIVKDINVNDKNVDDKDATVELELKVYYEDNRGYVIKKYVTAIAIIEDGEIKDLDFIKTD